MFGVRSEEVYEQAKIAFGPGDRLVLLTDGITEAADDHDEEFGEDRIVELLRENRHLGAAELQQQLLSVVECFAASGFRDDATLAIVSFTAESNQLQARSHDHTCPRQNGRGAAKWRLVKV